MYLIRYNKKSKLSLLTEKYHIADLNGITQLVDNYMSDFINRIAKIRKGWSELTPTFSIVNLTDRTNPCRDWLGNDTVVHYISRKERNIDNENKGLTNTEKAFIGKDDKIHKIVILIYISYDLLLSEDLSVYKKELRYISEALQHEFTHAYDIRRRWLEDDEESDNTEKMSYYEAYDKVQEWLKDDYERYTGKDKIRAKIINVFGEIFYRLGQDELNAHRSGYYRELLWKKKEADNNNEEMPALNSFDEYKEIKIFYDSGIAWMKKYMFSDDPFIHEAFRSAYQEIAPIFSTMFGIKNVTPKKMFSTLAKTIEKEVRRFQDLYGTVKTYGEIPVNESKIK